jgi:hypothetical protein
MFAMQKTVHEPVLTSLHCGASRRASTKVCLPEDS